MRQCANRRDGDHRFMGFDSRNRQGERIETSIRAFYDHYWPSHFPSSEDLKETERHLHKIIPKQRYTWTLDAGCGLGVCSVALSEMSENVIALDISPNSLSAARHLAKRLERHNVEFVEASLADIPCGNGAFDLILCWGVLMYVPSVERVFCELARTLRRDGALVVAVHKKSMLTPLHEMVRRFFLRVPKAGMRPMIRLAAFLIRWAATAFGRHPARNDLSFEAKVEDFYVVPFKRFFSMKEIGILFQRHNFSHEVVTEYTGRFRSSSSFIVRGTKQV